MNIALLVLHVILSLGIITLVLLQKGAGASAGAAFGGGGGGAGSVFGASGSSNFLSKFTAILATGFFVNSLALAYIAAHRDVSTDSVLDNLPATEIIMPAPVEPSDVIPAADTSTMDDQSIPPAPEFIDETGGSLSDVPPFDETVRD